jgi:hypothetical protein
MEEGKIQEDYHSNTLIKAIKLSIGMRQREREGLKKRRKKVEKQAYFFFPFYFFSNHKHDFLQLGQ